MRMEAGEKRIAVQYSSGRTRQRASSPPHDDSVPGGPPHCPRSHLHAKHKAHHNMLTTNTSQRLLASGTLSVSPPHTRHYRCRGTGIPFHAWMCGYNKSPTNNNNNTRAACVPPVSCPFPSTSFQHTTYLEMAASWDASSFSSQDTSRESWEGSDTSGAAGGTGDTRTCRQRRRGRAWGQDGGGGG